MARHHVQTARRNTAKTEKRNGGKQNQNDTIIIKKYQESVYGNMIIATEKKIRIRPL
jgi:hypothetical protein